MLINRSIPNLFQGVSQQPATLRLPTQAELQENGFSSIVEGLKKRPPTNHVAKLRNSTATDAFVHTINRDSTEQYVVVLLNGAIEVYDLSGNQMTVNTPSGTTYLNCTTPRTDFACVTIADYTFIVNKTVTVAMDASTVAGSLTGSKQKFTDLPTSPSTGQIYEVAGDNSNSFDNYYVQYNGSVWHECAKPGEQYKVDATTMPWKLVRTGTNTFTFDKVTWGDRLSGDLTTNPKPSFVTRKINDIFFYRNRLGFLSDENIILSRAGEFFEFWQETMTALLDSDAIDVAASGNTVSILRHAIPFNTTLILFSDFAQFQMTTPTNTALTPKSVTINVTTRYQTDNKAKPVGIGQDLYFSVTRGNYTGIMEYSVQPLTYANDAADVTAHVPKYVPTGVFKLIGSSLYSSLFALNTTNRNEIYTYKFYWGEEDKKMQSSWSVWKMDTGDVILGGEMLNNRLYLTIQRSDGVYLEYIDIQEGATDTGMGVLVHLDRKKSITGSYSAGTGLTTWTLPYAYSGTVSAVLGADFGVNKGKTPNVSRPSTTTVTAIGDYSAHTVFLGIPYTFKYQFSQFYMKDEQKVTVDHYMLKMKYMSILYANTGYLDIKVTPYGRDVSTYKLTGDVLGSTAVLGSIPVSTGSLRVPLLAGSEGLVVEAQNSSWLPCALQSAEWNAKLSYTFRRI